MMNMGNKSKPSSPRIRIEKNGRAVLAGLNYQDLRALITAAQLYRYEQARLVKTEEHAAYQKRQLKLGDMLREAMDESISATHLPRKSLTIEDRRAKVIEERNDRILIDEIMDLIGSRQSASDKVDR